MYTRCPQCSTLFRITPEQLVTAQGRVRCGQCLTIFVALNDLSTDPVAGPGTLVFPGDDASASLPGASLPGLTVAGTCDPGGDPVADGVTGQGPDVINPDETDADHRATDQSGPGEMEQRGPLPDEINPDEIDPNEIDPDAIGPDGTDRDGLNPDVIDASSGPLEQDSVEAVTSESASLVIQDPAPMADMVSASVLPAYDGHPAGGGGDAVVAVNAFVYDDSRTPDLPAVIAGDLKDNIESRRRGRRWGWLLGSLVLLLTAALQVLWFQHDVLLRQYPESAPLIEAFCRHAPCRLPPQKDLDAFRLLSREVRGHPRVEGALLIQASMINRAAFAQPWPALRFTLFDNTGAQLASREFSPNEYLREPRDTGKADAEWMPSLATREVFLEVIGMHTPGAVSFEFDFVPLKPAATP